MLYVFDRGGGNGAITVAASETEKAQGKILTAEDFPPEVLEEAAAPRNRLRHRRLCEQCEQGKSNRISSRNQQLRRL